MLLKSDYLLEWYTTHKEHHDTTYIIEYIELKTTLATEIRSQMSLKELLDREELHIAIAISDVCHLSAKQHTHIQP